MINALALQGTHQGGGGPNQTAACSTHQRQQGIDLVFRAQRDSDVVTETGLDHGSDKRTLTVQQVRDQAGNISLLLLITSTGCFVFTISNVVLHQPTTSVGFLVI